MGPHVERNLPSDDCEDMISHMLVVDSAKRYNVADIVKHPWMKARSEDSDSDLDLLLDNGLAEDENGVQLNSELGQQILSHMASLDLDTELTVKSVAENSFDHHSAIYHLLADKFRKHPRAMISRSSPAPTTPLPVVTRTERRSSITTGIVERVEVPVEVHSSEAAHTSSPSTSSSPSSYSLPSTSSSVLTSHLSALAAFRSQYTQLEDSNHSDSDEEPSPEALARYLAMRRHTVGVSDPRHEASDDLRVKVPPYYPLMPQQLISPFPPLPDVNLTQGIPMVPTGASNPLFSPYHFVPLAGDPHLLRPPLLCQGSSLLGRRASDGGANIHLFSHFQRQFYANSQPGSHEGLPHMGQSLSPTGIPLPTQSLHNSVTVEESEDGASNSEPDPEAVNDYMQGRGITKRHTVAMVSPASEIPEELQYKLSLQQPLRTRRSTGLLSPSERSSHRDSYKDVHALHLPSERFSPVRRASDGSAISGKNQAYLESIYNQALGQSSGLQSTSGGSHSSLKQLQIECQELQKQAKPVAVDKQVEFQQQHTLHLLQQQTLQGSLSKSPKPSSPPLPGSPSYSAHRPLSPDTATQSALLYQQLQQLQLHHHHMASAGNSPRASPTLTARHRTSPPPMLVAGGVTSGIPPTAGSITTGIPPMGAPGKGVVAGITSGIPLSYANSSSQSAGSVVASGLPPFSLPSSMSPAASSGCGGSIVSGLPISRGSSPQNLPQGVTIAGPGSIPAESFTQMMQSYQSGSDTPPENFSKLLQTLQSPTRISSGSISGGGGSGSLGGLFSELGGSNGSCGGGGGGGGSGSAGSSPPLNNPVGGYAGLLQNYSTGLQRTSPPPNFQNLQMIREDSADVMDNGCDERVDEEEGEYEYDEEMRDDENESELHAAGVTKSGMPASTPARETYHSPLTPTSSSELEQYLQEPTSTHYPRYLNRRRGGKKRVYVGNPQISITDAHGHVTDVITTDPSDTTEDRMESPRNSITGMIDVDVSMSNASSHSKQQEQQQKQVVSQQQLKQLFNPGWVNTNLASIPSGRKNTPQSSNTLCSTSSLPFSSTAASSSMSRSMPFSTLAYSSAAVRHHPHHHPHHRSSGSRLRRHAGYHSQQHHYHHQPQLQQHQQGDPACDILYSPISSPHHHYYSHQVPVGYSHGHQPADSYNPLGFMSLSSHRQHPVDFQTRMIPLLSSRSVSPTCVPPDLYADSPQQAPPIVIPRITTSLDDSSLSNFTPEHSTAALPHSSPSSLVCSPTSSPVPVITASPPVDQFSGQGSPSGLTSSSSPSPSPPQITGSMAAMSSLSSSRPSSPLFPSVGPSPSSSSPTNGCYSPATSPFPTPANTPRPSICTTDSGHSEMEQDFSPLSDESSNMSSILLQIKPTHRKSVEDVLRAVKAALDSISQVDYECSDTSFKLNGHSDLQMELEVCSEMDGHVPGLQVRKLSGDNLEYAKLCNHLMACVNN